MASDAMPSFLGLDAGATRTRALLIDGRETVLFRGEAGPGGLLDDPDAAGRWGEAVGGCPPPDAVFGGFAGMVGAARREAAHAWLSERFPGAPVRVGPDIEALPAAADGFDVVVLAGTGSGVCSGVGESFVRSGGGGPLLGDPGSAFDVVRRAAWMALFSARGGPGPLREALTAELDDPDPRAFAAWAAEPGSRPRVAALARAVANCASIDPLAAEAIESAMAALADETRAHVERHVPAGRVRVALAGGLWQAHSLTTLTLAAALQNRKAPTDRHEYVVGLMTEEPVLGAARLASRLWHGN